MASSDPDLALLELWRRGDQRAGHQLFERHFAEVYRFLEHKAGGSGDELTQRTFLACVTARDAFRGQSSFRTFLFAIARHELYQHLRSARRDQVIDFEVTSLGAIAASATSPVSRLARNRRVDQLRLALSALPAEQQLLLEMHYWHDLDAAGLAEVFATTAGAIRVRLVRARHALRSRLEAIGVTGDADTAMLAAVRSPHDDGDRGTDTAASV